MLSRQDNETMTRVGPGTPAGNLLRRYWHAICPAAEITAQKPKKRLKVLGEELVLFRDGSGKYGLVGEHCPHRAASLYYGTVEPDGIRCAYHGWKFDARGKCLEQPLEPQGRCFKEEINHTAYRIEELAGILFAYMGPRPAPLLPRWDLLVREDGIKKIVVLPEHKCNWLQTMENSVDPAHTFYLHAHQFKIRGMKGGEYYGRPIEKLEFEEVRGPLWAGVLKKRTYADSVETESEAGHPLVFPNMLYAPQGPDLVIHWRTPIDDANTYVIWMTFRPSKDGARVEQPARPPVEYLPPMLTPEGEYEMTTFASQDMMAWETQGPVFDRTKEHLGATDRGITLYRRLLKEQIRVVADGGEPLGLIRDAAQNRCVTFDVSKGQAREEYLKTWSASYHDLSHQVE
ncbi:MAG TPA: Rieske 2Fe-2S domain-containing protein [Candidatus Binatia bacterium]